MVKTYGHGAQLNEKLNEYISVYIRPIYESSEMVLQFNKIHSSQQLNQLLYDNIKGLEKLFEEYKTPDSKFTIDSA